MAEQTEIGYEQTKEWQQFQTGGTRVDADDLNRMEGGIVDACAAVDELRTKRLPTYVVAQDGDTATQDVYMEDILGPCLILDLATRTTYYETGGDEEGHRKAITSGADIDELRDSLSRTVVVGSGATRASVGSDQYGPFITIYVSDGEERTTFRFLHPSYNAPCVVKTTQDGDSNTVWHG